MLCRVTLVAFLAVFLVEFLIENARGDLITNGDFEDGNTGFTSEYFYSPGNIFPPQTYDLVDNPRNSHSSAASYGDHTSGEGLMMAVNGSTNAEIVVWSQQVVVQPGTAYRFAIWTSTWTSNAGLLLQINSNSVGDSFITPVTAGIWERTTRDWNSGDATSALIEIKNTTTQFGGNDFAIDDIVFMAIADVHVSSSFPADAAAIVGTLSQQIDAVNTGPPSSDFGPVRRHADLHVQSSFDCLAGDGAIADVSGAFELLNQPPPSVLNGQLTSNTNIRVFTEMTRIAAESDAIVDATEPGTYNNNNPPPPEGVVIPAGSLVSSHLLHFDTTSDTQAATLSGTVTFKSDVLGVIFRGERLIFTDDADPVNGPFLGSPTTSYPGNPDRTWEIGANGFFTIGEDRRTVTAQALVQDFLDQLRIVAAASPADVLAEPYVSADQFIDDADEVTLDNCSSAWYRFTFELPPNFTSPSLSAIANVDDVAVAYLNGNRISAMVNIDDLGLDRVDAEGRPLLSWPTRDSFETCNSSHFVAGTNELVFGVVGDLSSFDPTGLEFEASIAFDETTLLGDVNLDGVVSLLDINPFVDLLTSSEFQAEADINQDGVVDLLDVQPFVQLLIGE